MTGKRLARFRPSGAVLPSMPEAGAVDLITSDRLMAVQARVIHGMATHRIAERLGVSRETVDSWFREPMVLRASAELTRAYIGMEILPLALRRLRMELNNPLANLTQVSRAVAYLAELSGLRSQAGVAPGAALYDGSESNRSALSRPIAELTANELRDLAERGQQALATLESERSSGDGDGKASQTQ